MAPNTSTERGESSRWILIGSAVLGAVFTYFAFSVLTIPILDKVFRMDIFHYRNFPLFLGIVIVAGAGLRWTARRYRTWRVQVGALLGAGILTVVGFVQVWGFWNAGIVVPFVVTLPVGLGILVTVALLTANPSPESNAYTGVTLLRQSLPRVRRRRGEEIIPDVHQLLPDSREWFVVAGAFAVCIPLALVNTELGLGLLSSFLTAYAMLHRIERESRDVDEE